MNILSENEIFDRTNITYLTISSKDNCPLASNKKKSNDKAIKVKGCLVFILNF